MSNCYVPVIMVEADNCGNRNVTMRRSPQQIEMIDAPEPVVIQSGSSIWYIYSDRSNILFKASQAYKAVIIAREYKNGWITASYFIAPHGVLIEKYRR